jgi:hypothetical protein
MPGHAHQSVAENTTEAHEPQHRAEPPQANNNRKADAMQSATMEQCMGHSIPDCAQNECLQK